MTIPKIIRVAVWNKYIGDTIGKTKCPICNILDITQFDFHCGHVIAQANGGNTVIENLRPICYTCNLSMKTTNMREFALKNFRRDIPYPEIIDNFSNISTTFSNNIVTQKNVTNTIKLNIFGNENIKIIPKDLLYECTITGLEGLKKLFELIYTNPIIPENHNIRIDDKRYISIYTRNGWISDKNKVILNKIIEELYNYTCIIYYQVPEVQKNISYRLLYSKYHDFVNKIIPRYIYSDLQKHIYNRLLCHK